MRKHVIEDSSYIISLMLLSDVNHKVALNAFNSIYACKTDLKTVIPTTAFYETLYTLLKAGISYYDVKEKLVRMMMIDHLVNYQLSEAVILKLAKNTGKLISSNPTKQVVRAHDLMILTVAMEFENSCLITGDRGLLDYKKVFPNIFCFDTSGGLEELRVFLAQ